MGALLLSFVSLGKIGITAGGIGESPDARTTLGGESAVGLTLLTAPTALWMPRQKSIPAHLGSVRGMG